MHAPSSNWVFLLHCHQFRKPLMEKINPDTQTSPLCLFTWRVIIAARDLHPANICSPSPNYGPRQWAPPPRAPPRPLRPPDPWELLLQRHKPGSHRALAPPAHLPSLFGRLQAGSESFRKSGCKRVICSARWVPAPPTSESSHLPIFPARKCTVSSPAKGKHLCLIFSIK